jgi:hypothetical protein
MTTAPEPGQFPRELSELDLAHAALDTDAMLAGLNDLTDIGGDTSATSVDEETTEQPGDAQVTEGDGGGGADATVPTPVPPGMVDFEGKLLPVEEVRALLALSDRLKEDPEAAKRIAEAAKGPVATDTPPALPSFIDPTDTTAVGLYREVEGLKAAEARREAQSRTNAESVRRANVVDSFRSAVSNFKAAHPNLTDEDVAKVADATGRMNIIEGLERHEGSLTAAFERGMEMTMWGTPELRSLAAADNADKVSDKNKVRKQKSSALSGSGGSVPRNSPTKKTPSTREELMEVMLADVRSDPSLSATT